MSDMGLRVSWAGFRNSQLRTGSDVSKIGMGGSVEFRRCTEVQSEDVTTHSVIEPSSLNNKLPLGARRDHGCSPERLQGFVTKLLV